MKELSIAEKAKAYDELLVKLQEAKVDNNVCDERYCCVIDDIVPELKESEEEKIRKTLIDFFSKGAKNGAQTNGIYDKDIIAWLEKQGESNPYIGVSFKYNGHTWGMCARDNGVEILVDGKIKERVFLSSYHE
jgi:hypothetical protein